MKKQSITSRVSRRIGHRGAFLALVALAFVLYGLGLFYEPGELHHIDFFLSFNWWPRMFFATGVAMFLTGVSRPKKDSYAFGIASFLSAWWAIRWYHVWIIEGGDSGAWPVALMWTVIAAIILLVSTWPEARKRRRFKEWGKDDEGEDM